MTALIDGGGARLDLLVQRGTDMPSVDMVCTNTDGTPVDFTGCTLIVSAATLSDEPEQLNIEAMFVDAAGGHIAVDLASEEIARMAVNASTTSRPRVSGKWTLAVQYAAGNVEAMFYGEISVRAAA